MLSNNNALKARVMQSLSDSCSARRRSMQHVFFRLVRYHKVVSRVLVVKNDDVRENKENIAKAQEKRLEKTEGSKYQYIPCLITYADVSFFPFKKDKCEEDEILVELSYSPQSWLPVV